MARRFEDPVRAASQTIRFCTTPDGVRLAYAVSGHGLPLVKAANYLTHLEHGKAASGAIGCGS